MADRRGVRDPGRGAVLGLATPCVPPAERADRHNGAGDQCAGSQGGPPGAASAATATRPRSACRPGGGTGAASRCGRGSTCAGGARSRTAADTRVRAGAAAGAESRAARDADGRNRGQAVGGEPTGGADYRAGERRCVDAGAYRRERQGRTTHGVGAGGERGSGDWAEARGPAGRAVRARAIRQHQPAHRGGVAAGVSSSRAPGPGGHASGRCEQAAADAPVGSGAGSGHRAAGRSRAGRRSDRWSTGTRPDGARCRGPVVGGDRRCDLAGRGRRRPWRHGLRRPVHCWTQGPRSPRGRRPTDAAHPARAADRGGGACRRLVVGWSARPGHRRDRRSQLRSCHAGSGARPGTGVWRALRRVPAAWRLGPAAAFPARATGGAASAHRRRRGDPYAACAGGRRDG